MPVWHPITLFLFLRQEGEMATLNEDNRPLPAHGEPPSRKIEPVMIHEKLIGCIGSGCASNYVNVCPHVVFPRESQTRAILNLLDGRRNSDMPFDLVWAKFRHIKRFLAYRPHQVARICHRVRCVTEGCPGPWSNASAGCFCS